MLRKCKYFLLSFIFFISSFLPCMYCHAQGETWTDSEKAEFFSQGFYHIVCDVAGLIFPTGLGGADLKRDFEAYVVQGPWIQNNMSYDDWIAHEITGVYINGNSGNSDITISADLQNAIKEWGKYYIDNNLGFVYGYTFNASSLLYLYSNQDDYHAVLDLISSHSDSIIIIQIPARNSIPQYFYELPLSSTIGFVKSSSDDIKQTYNCDIYDGWDKLPLQSFNIYKLNTSNHTISQQSNVSGAVYGKLSQINNNTPTYNYNDYYFISQNINQYQIYNSLNALKQGSEGVQGYYVTDSYNTNEVTDSYNTTTNNINNSITYGDVQNYVNNYYVENNEYPTTNIVYQYITNYVPSDNGGSGDDNGGGNGNIFDFLGTIGDFLGNLIEGIGNVLSGILSAITDVIDMFIGENGLPNVIGQLVNYFLPFLPDWVPTVIGLSVTLALLIGIVKLIRGS